LLANTAAMYAVYHGPVGLTAIADKVHGYTRLFASTVKSFGYKITNDTYFDTVTVDVSAVVQSTKQIHDASVNAAINLRIIDDKLLGVTFDESITPDDLVNLLNVFGSAASAPLVQLSSLSAPSSPAIPQYAKRTSDFLSQPVFNKHHSETEMLRYMNHLASKDLGLANAMIPLGSCTMKLNSTSSMAPITWPEFSTIHPFAPLDQTKGYLTIIKVML
jgi:glycine dehydrogenase